VFSFNKGKDVGVYVSGGVHIVFVTEFKDVDNDPLFDGVPEVSLNLNQTFGFFAETISK
jgi:hypothetical protein